MGCEMSLVIEYMNPFGGEWTNWGSDILPSRNYRMFALMAGVRDENSICLYNARGLPFDGSYYTKLIAYDDADSPESKLKLGYHSHSWLKPKEFYECIKAYPGQAVEILEYRVAYSALEFLEKNNHPARIVFWFDG